MAIKRIRPFLKWAGGKYALLPTLIKLFPPGDVFVEPFVGGGSVFLNTNYPRYLLNDTNPDLIHLYQTVKRSGSTFIDNVRDLFKPKNNTEKAYYALRDKFNLMPSNHEKAALFIYLNRHGYNGLCRYNRSGQFNVPFGDYRKPLFPEEALYRFHEKSQKATFTCLDFAAVMKKIKKSAVIYCDPPYTPLSKTANFTKYHQGAFDEAHHTRLATLAKQLSGKGHTVIISNHKTDFTQALYQGATQHEIYTTRTISCNVNERNAVSELIAVFD